MEYREFLTLTDEEVKQIVTDIFAAKKVTNIKRSKKWDEITCKIYTEWETTDDTGKEVVDLIPDELTLCDPFKGLDGRTFQSRFSCETGNNKELEIAGNGGLYIKLPDDRFISATDQL